MAASTISWRLRATSSLMEREDVIVVASKAPLVGLSMVFTTRAREFAALATKVRDLGYEGYVVAEGKIRSVRGEMEEHPLQILVRCDRPAALASKVFEQDGVVEARIDKDLGGLLIKTRDADKFYLAFNRIVLDNGFKIEVVTPADEDVDAVYQYLIGSRKDEA